MAVGLAFLSSCSYRNLAIEPTEATKASEHGHIPIGLVVISDIDPNAEGESAFDKRARDCFVNSLRATGAFDSVRNADCSRWRLNDLELQQNELVVDLHCYGDPPMGLRFLLSIFIIPLPVMAVPDLIYAANEWRVDCGMEILSRDKRPWASIPGVQCRVTAEMQGFVPLGELRRTVDVEALQKATPQLIENLLSSSAFDEARRSWRAREEARQTEERRSAEEARQGEERRKAQEARQAEDRRKAEEARQAEERRKAEQEKRNAELARARDADARARKADEATSADQLRMPESPVPATDAKPGVATKGNAGLEHAPQQTGQNQARQVDKNYRTPDTGRRSEALEDKKASTAASLQDRQRFYKQKLERTDLTASERAGTEARLNAVVARLAEAAAGPDAEWVEVEISGTVTATGCAPLFMINVIAGIVDEEGRPDVEGGYLEITNYRSKAVVFTSSAAGVNSPGLPVEPGETYRTALGYHKKGESYVADVSVRYRRLKGAKDPATQSSPSKTSAPSPGSSGATTPGTSSTSDQNAPAPGPKWRDIHLGGSDSVHNFGLSQDVQLRTNTEGTENGTGPSAWYCYLQNDGANPVRVEVDWGDGNVKTFVVSPGGINKSTDVPLPDGSMKGVLPNMTTGRARVVGD